MNTLQKTCQAAAEEMFLVDDRSENEAVAIIERHIRAWLADSAVSECEILLDGMHYATCLCVRKDQLA